MFAGKSPDTARVANDFWGPPNRVWSGKQHRNCAHECKNNRAHPTGQLHRVGATRWGSLTISPQWFWKNGYLRDPPRPSAAQKGRLRTRPGAARVLPPKNGAFLRTEMTLFSPFFSEKTREILQKKEKKTRSANSTPQYRVGVFNLERFCLLFLQNFASFFEKKWRKNDDYFAQKSLPFFWLFSAPKWLYKH